MNQEQGRDSWDSQSLDRDRGQPPARGLRALTGEEFSATEAIGGWRGAVESVAPGLLFVVVYLVAGQRLLPALIASAAAALIAVVARLVQRTPVTQAFAGVLGVVVGVIWAWRTGKAQDYFLYGLWVNVAYGLGTLATILAGFPLVGLVVGLFARNGPLAGGSWGAVVAWRADASLRRRYAWATWPWVVMFALRLAIQVPLYRTAQVAWLGTAKLVMGLPLTALALWLSWRLVRRSTAAATPPPTRPDP
ncbi:MAG: DUF3159 domain-containing protein [Micrococcales bacterium]|nr:DUF3159 domain-containing protein [Micrococcales bacterium]